MNKSTAVELVERMRRSRLSWSMQSEPLPEGRVYALWGDNDYNFHVVRATNHFIVLSDYRGQVPIPLLVSPVTGDLYEPFFYSEATPRVLVDVLPDMNTIIPPVIFDTLINYIQTATGGINQFRGRLRPHEIFPVDPSDSVWVNITDRFGLNDSLSSTIELSDQ